MKKRQVLKVASTYEDLNVEELNRYNLGVEIQDFTEPNFTADEIEEILEIYKNSLKGIKGIKSMHGPFLDLKPASPDYDIRNLSIKRYEKAMEIATILDMDYIVFHSQINPDLNETFIRELNCKQNAQVWNEIVGKFKGFKGIILIENVFEKDPYVLKELLDCINLDNVKVNLDIGHVKLTNVPLEEWVFVLKDYLVYSHVHTNDGNYDRHSPITKEEIIHYYNILNNNGINPVITLEYRVLDLDKEIEKFI